MGHDTDKIHGRHCHSRLTSGKAGSEIEFNVKRQSLIKELEPTPEEGKVRKQKWAEREVEL